MALKAVDITLNQNTASLSGDLNFYNVMSIYEKSLSFFAECQELQFDFTELQSSDSAGIALIVEWMKLGERCNKPVKLKNLSAALRSIARVGGLDAMFTNAASAQ